MTLTYRGNGAWGTGKGSPLTKAEADGNTWDLDQRIVDLEDAEPLSIADIQTDGVTMTIIMSDDSEFGPFVLPVASFNPRGAWTTGTPYAVGDLVTQNGLGLFLCVIAHTSSGGSLDPEEGGTDPVWMLVTQLLEQDTTYLIPFFQKGGLERAGAPVWVHVFTREVVLDGTGEAIMKEAPGIQDQVLSVYKNGTELMGTITFEQSTALDEVVGVFDFVTDVFEFEAGDYVEVREDEQTDTAADGAHVSVTLHGDVVLENI